MSLFDSARFLTSAAAVSQLPGAGLPEIAFAGRSNAGKSTTINVLTRQGRLAFASKTPGRTQLINFFTLSRKIPDSKEREQIAHLVDLPGYGYAKAAPEIRETWSRLIGGYLSDFFSSRSHVRQLWLINKCDQIKRAERNTVLAKARARAQQLGDHVEVQLFSGLKKEGVEELQQRLLTWIDPEGRLSADTQSA